MVQRVAGSIPALVNWQTEKAICKLSSGKGSERTGEPLTLTAPMATQRAHDV